MIINLSTIEIKNTTGKAVCMGVKTLSHSKKKKKLKSKGNDLLRQQDRSKVVFDKNVLPGYFKLKK